MVNKEITKEMIDAARADVIMVDGPLFRDPVYKLKSRKNWSFNNEDAAVVAYLVDAITGRETAPHLMKRDLEKLEKRIRKAIEKVESKAGHDVYVGNIITFSMDGLAAMIAGGKSRMRGMCLSPAMPAVSMVMMRGSLAISSESSILPTSLFLTFARSLVMYSRSVGWPRMNRRKSTRTFNRLNGKRRRA